ncbi:unnamed protein product [Phytophthora fragariaefolia]|uniref:Unnamed protein product n=1 Tax=Phytophthora fragariaefolia TaxID=1490495 RepID=A0A9W7DB32_9STRA|nr:unnamed protein product [Phytophthora fragariaefolia]
MQNASSNAVGEASTQVVTAGAVQMGKGAVFAAVPATRKSTRPKENASSNAVGEASAQDKTAGVVQVGEGAVSGAVPATRKARRPKQNGKNVLFFF